MAANTIPTVSTLPPAPTRADAPADFTAKADTFVAALPGLVTQVNLTVKGMNDQASYLDQLKTDVNGYKNAAAQSAADATTQAGNAKTYADNAMTYRDSAQTAAAAAQSAAGMPSITGKADFMMSVNAAGNGVEWRASIPRPTAANAGKVVRINSAGNAYELGDGSPISKYFESSRQTILSNSFTSVSHGLGVPPKIVSAYLICTSAAAGYQVGDRVEISTSSVYADANGTVGFRLIQVTSDATSLYLKQTSNIFIPFKDASGQTAGVSSSSFAIVLRAAA